MGEALRLAASLPARLKGLLLRSGFDGVLLIVPCRDIHTWGMRRSLDVAFVGAQGRVLAAYRDVGPRRRLRHRDARAVLERFHDARADWFQEGDLVVITGGKDDGYENVSSVRSPGLR